MQESVLSCNSTLFHGELKIFGARPYSENPGIGDIKQFSSIGAGKNIRYILKLLQVYW